MERVYHYLGRGRWFRQVKPHGRIKLGGYQYYLGRRLAGQAVAITFDATTGHLLCQPEGQPVAVAAQGLSVDDLMGELAGVVRLPTYHLALPLSPRDYRAQQYVAALAGTN